MRLPTTLSSAVTEAANEILAAAAATCAIPSFRLLPPLHNSAITTARVDIWTWTMDETGMVGRDCDPAQLDDRVRDQPSVSLSLILYTSHLSTPIQGDQRIFVPQKN